MATSTDVDQNLRPMTDRSLAASTINCEDTDMAKRMQQNRRRWDAQRIMLGGQAGRGPGRSFAQLPLTRAAREARR